MESFCEMEEGIEELLGFRDNLSIMYSELERGLKLRELLAESFDIARDLGQDVQGVKTAIDVCVKEIKTTYENINYMLHTCRPND